MKRKSWGHLFSHFFCLLRSCVLDPWVGGGDPGSAGPFVSERLQKSGAAIDLSGRIPTSWYGTDNVFGGRHLEGGMEHVKGCFRRRDIVLPAFNGGRLAS